MNQPAVSQDQEQVLRDAVQAAHELATARPTKVNRSSLKKAQKELDAFLASRTAPKDVLQNIPALVEYLDGEGWKISISTAYEHRDQAKLQLQDDGTITMAMALEYAAANLNKRDGTREDFSSRRQREMEETRRISADANMRELKFRERMGELIERSDVEVELAARATNLKSYFDSVARQSAGRICKLVGGDPQKIPHLVEFLLGVNRKAFDNYARPILVDEEED